jgi:STE24 endopeptidase
MSEMTAIRMAAFGTLAGGWILAAVLLWRADVGPAAPALDPVALFGRETVERNGRYADVLRLLWALGAAAQLAALVALWRRGPRLAAALAAPLAVAVALVAALPFDLARHWWRRRHGVARLDDVAFVLDRWPTVLAQLALAVLAALLVVGLARLARAHWWLAAWGAFALLAAAYLVAVPTMLAPRLEPAPPRVAAEVRALGRALGLEDVRVEVREARRRTRAVNAEAVGLGATTAVVLWDTLLDLPPSEVRFLAAHELAHVARRHLWKGWAWFALLSLPAAWALGRLVRPVGADVPKAAAILLSLWLVSLPVQSVLSRRYEREADVVALRATGDAASAEAVYRRFVRVSLADPDPPRLVHLVLGTHPTVPERIATARALDP